MKYVNATQAWTTIFLESRMTLSYGPYITWVWTRIPWKSGADRSCAHGSLAVSSQYVTVAKLRRTSDARVY